MPRCLSLLVRGSKESSSSPRRTTRQLYDIIGGNSHCVACLSSGRCAQSMQNYGLGRRSIP